MNFNLDKQELKAFNIFKKQCEEELLKYQKETYTGSEREEYYKKQTQDWTVPYTGAIGGLFTFEFTPTYLGNKVVVKCCHPKKEKDLTNYDAW